MRNPQRDPPGNQSRRSAWQSIVSESCVESGRPELRSVDSEQVGRVIQPRKREMGGRRGLLIGRHHDDLASQSSSLPGVQEHGTFALGFPRNLRDLCVSSSNNG
jgi:hypothetical protein